MRLLTKRQEEILRAVVRQYTTTGQPVGSKGLVDQLPMKVSSATVRNRDARKRWLLIEAAFFFGANSIQARLSVLC